jgi:hypothetical protein
MFFRSQAVNAAAETNSVVAAYYASTPRAAPFGILTLDKIGERISLYKCEVIDETRPVILLIPCVDSLYVRAWKCATLITKLDSMTQKKITALLERCALPVSRTTAGAVRHLHALAPNVVPVREITAAD